MNQRELAVALGLSAPMITKLAKREACQLMTWRPPSAPRRFAAPAVTTIFRVACGLLKFRIKDAA